MQLQISPTEGAWQAKKTWHKGTWTLQGGIQMNRDVAKLTAEMMLPQTKKNSVLKVWTEVYSSWAVMDPWKNVATS